MQKKERLCIIDGNHLIHRAFYAIKAGLTTRGGEPTNALFGFASMLFNIMEAEHPEYLMVAFDEHAPTFRHEAHAEYKAQRVKAPDELYAQIPRIREMVKVFGVPLLFQAGYEADDFMGTVANAAARAGMETILVTGDMDALQLISADILVAAPHKGYKEPIIYDAAKVKEKYGVTPAQIADFKALMGDSSDNIKGVQGIGPKGAAQLLSRYNDLDGIYAHLHEIPLLLRQKLERGRQDAYFAQGLTRIVTDIPYACDWKAAQVSSFHYRDLERFLESMEMRSLKKRLEKMIPAEKRAGPDQMSLF